MKKNKIATQKSDPIPEGMELRVDKACDLILECLDVNQISKSDGLSALASVLVSILAHYQDDKHFVDIIRNMTKAFAESRKN